MSPSPAPSTHANGNHRSPQSITSPPTYTNHSPTLSPINRTMTPPATRATLTNLLAETTKELDIVRKASLDAQRRSAHFEHLYSTKQIVQDSPQERAFQKIQSLERQLAEAEAQIREMEARLRSAEEKAAIAEERKKDADRRARDLDVARENEEARRAAIKDLWAQMRNYLETMEMHGREARLGFDRIIETGGGVLTFEPGRVRSVAEMDPGPRVYNSPRLLDFQRQENALQRERESLKRDRERDNISSHAPPPTKKARSLLQVGIPQPTSAAYLEGPPSMASAPIPSNHNPRQHPLHHHPQRYPRGQTPSDAGSLDDVIAEVTGEEPRSATVTSKHYSYPSSGRSSYQTHVFAPVVTGAPVKKSKTYPSLDETTLHRTTTSPAVPSPPTAVFPPQNEQGQRICRQCGMAGRYKDGKCVEKWGPGPMGPGTVCDRCRKKMKRVERRGAMEQLQFQTAPRREYHVPPPQPPPPTMTKPRVIQPPPPPPLQQPKSSSEDADGEADLEREIDRDVEMISGIGIRDAVIHVNRKIETSNMRAEIGHASRSRSRDGEAELEEEDEQGDEMEMEMEMGGEGEMEDLDGDLMDAVDAAEGVKVEV